MQRGWNGGLPLFGLKPFVLQFPTPSLCPEAPPRISPAPRPRGSGGDVTRTSNRGRQPGPSQHHSPGLSDWSHLGQATQAEPRPAEGQAKAFRLSWSSEVVSLVLGEHGVEETWPQRGTSLCPCQHGVAGSWRRSRDPIVTFKGRPSPGVHLAKVCALVLKKTPLSNTRSTQFGRAVPDEPLGTGRYRCVLSRLKRDACGAVEP